MMEMSGKHKYPKKSRVWRRKENMGKLNKRDREQLPDPAMEDEWRRYQIREGGIGKMGENNYPVRLWSMTGEESKLGGGKMGNG